MVKHNCQNAFINMKLFQATKPDRYTWPLVWIHRQNQRNLGAFLRDNNGIASVEKMKLTGSKGYFLNFISTVHVLDTLYFQSWVVQR